MHKIVKTVVKLSITEQGNQKVMLLYEIDSGF